MEQDFKKLLLNLGEDLAKAFVSDIVKPELEKFIKNSENKYDDMLLAFIPQLEQAVLKALDKVDGEVG